MILSFMPCWKITHRPAGRSVFMRTPMQRKYAIAWHIGGAQVGKINLSHSIISDGAGDWSDWDIVEAEM